jgi:plasmid stability protein
MQRCVTIAWMDSTIRNLDEVAYRQLKARAALTGRTIGELVNEAIYAYLNRPEPGTGRRSLADLGPEDYPRGTEHLSEDIDAVVYGA